VHRFSKSDNWKRILFEDRIKMKSYAILMTKTVAWKKADTIFTLGI